MRGRKTARRDAERRLEGLFADLVSEAGDNGIIGFSCHAGISLPRSNGDDWWPTFLAHYLNGFSIDETRVTNDLTSWGPIRARVKEIRAE